MKKFIFSLIVLAFSSVAFSATVQWGASGFSDSFNGGTAYLISATSTTSTISGIASYIQTNGLSYSGSNTYSQWGTATVTSDEDGAYFENAPVSSTPSAGTYDKVFILVLDGDSGKFALIDYFSVTVPDNDTLVNIKKFGETWTEGTVGSTPVTPEVPEPTILALLALGVAGLALKRKTV